MFNHIPRIIGACESPPCGGKDFPGSFILPQVLSWAFLAVAQKVSLAGSRGSFSHPGVLPHKRNKDDKTTVVTRATCLFSLSLETRVERGTTYESFLGSMGRGKGREKWALLGLRGTGTRWLRSEG